MCRRAEEYTASGMGKPTLEIDCELPVQMLTEQNVQWLSQLEPCGTGCPRPIFCMSELTIERITAVGNGRHLRLRLRAQDGTAIQAIYFSAGTLLKSLYAGERVDIAFHLQINEYHDTRTVQLNLLDLREASADALYDRFASQQPLSEYERAALTPQRSDIADVWNYLRRAAPQGRPLRCELNELCLAVAAFSQRHSIRRTLACLEILSELRLIELRRERSCVEVRIIPESSPNPLENSRIYHTLRGE